MEWIHLKFTNHKKFDCVCENEVFFTAPLKGSEEGEDLLQILKSHGFEVQRCFQELDYKENWFAKFEETNKIEWLRATCEWMWNYKCHQECSSKSGTCLDSCKVFQSFFRYALSDMDESLTLSDDWYEKTTNEIEIYTYIRESNKL